MLRPAAEQEPGLREAPSGGRLHDVLALPVSAFVQVPGVLPNLQPLFECEFERNAAAFGAVLVLIVFLFPFAHVGLPTFTRPLLCKILSIVYFAL
jgi:hypothetical protein